MVSRDAEILLRRLEANPADAAAFVQLVNLYQAAGDTRGLVALLERRVEVLATAGADSAQISALHLELGELWERSLSRQDRALHHYRKAFEHDASCVPALYAAREIYRAAGNMKNAAILYDLEANAETDPERRAALYRELAYVRYQDLGDLDGGLVAIQRALALAPQDASIHSECASMLLARADRADGVPGGAGAAVQDRRKAADLLVRVARLAQPTEAQGFLEAALDADPGNEEALLDLDERTREAGGDLATLVPRYRAYLTAAPDAEFAASVRRTLGYIAMQQGAVEEALTCFEAIDDPSDTDLASWIANLRAQAGPRPARAPAAPSPTRPEPAPPEQPAKAGPAWPLAPEESQEVSFGAGIVPQEPEEPHFPEPSSPDAAFPAEAPAPPEETEEAAAPARAEGEPLPPVETPVEERPKLDERAARAPAEPAPRRKSAAPVMAAPVRERKVSRPPAETGVDVVSRLRSEAARFAESGDEESAALRMGEILEIDPGDPEATTFLEDFYTDREDWDALRELLMLGVRVPGASIEARKARLRQVAAIAEERQQDLAGAAAAWRASLALDPTDEIVRKTLHRTLEAGGLWDDLVKLLGKELLTAADSSEKLRISRRIGEICLRQQEDPAAAIAHFKKAHEIDPADAEIRKLLEEALEGAEAFADLVALLQRAADEESDPAARAERRKKAARVLDGRLGDTEGAFAECEKALDAVPGDEEVLSLMESIDEAAENWERLADTHRRRLDAARDVDAKIAVLSKIALLEEERLGFDERAIDTWLRALDQKPAHQDALTALERLMTRHKRHEDLRDALAGALSVTTEKADRAAIHRRLARLYDGPLEDAEKARFEWERVLEAEEDDEALRALLAHADSEKRTKDVVDLLGKIEARLEDPTERTLLLLRRADLQTAELEDGHGAVETLRHLLADVDTENVEALASLRDALGRLGEHREAADAAEQELALRTDAKEQRALLVYLGGTYRDQVGDAGKAIGAFERLRALVPKDPAARDALEALYADAGEHEKLFALLRERAQEETGRAKSERLQRAAEVAETGLGNPTAAFALLREAFELDRSDADVLDSIRALSMRAKLHDALVGLLYELSQASEGDERASKLKEISRIYEKVVEDHPRALEAILQAFQIDPDDWGYLDSVDRVVRAGSLFERGSQVYEALVRREQESEKKATLLRRYAKLVREGAKDPSAAMELEVRALAQNPQDPEILATIEELAAETERYEDLLIVYDRLRSVSPKEEAASWHLRAYKTVTRHFEDEDRAGQILRKALKTGPGREDLHAEAEKVASEVDAASPEGERFRGTRALIAAYREIAEGVEDSTAEGKLLSRVAYLTEHALDDLRGAFETYQEVIAADPRAQGAFAEAERLAEELGDWQSLAATYETVLRDAVDPTVVRPVRRRLAHTLGHRLDRPDEAADQLWSLVQIDPSDREARDSLEALYEKTERWNDLLLLLEREGATGTGEEQVATQRRVAKIWEEKLGNRFEALEAWEAVLQLVPGDLEAEAAVDRLRAPKRVDEEDDLLDDVAPPPKFDLEAEEREEEAPPPEAAAEPEGAPEESPIETAPEEAAPEGTEPEEAAPEGAEPEEAAPEGAEPGAEVALDEEAIVAEDEIIEEEPEAQAPEAPAPTAPEQAREYPARDSGFDLDYDEDEDSEKEPGEGSSA